MRITDESFIEEIAPARTFGFLKEVEMLRQRGLALGGSLDNAIVLGETGVLNNALRFEDEFVRHKILDVIGDLALVGYPIIGHLVAHRGGHALHTASRAEKRRGGGGAGGGGEGEEEGSAAATGTAAADVGAGIGTSAATLGMGGGGTPGGRGGGGSSSERGRAAGCRRGRRRGRGGRRGSGRPSGVIW